MLVVDDVPALRTMLTRQLRRAGHVVVGEAGTLAEAVAAAARLVPEVVLLDVQLPDGLGTDAVARLVGRGGPDTVECGAAEDGVAAEGAGDGTGGGPRDLQGTGARPAVVLCTGDTNAVDWTAAARAGAFALLEKPVPAADLDAAVRRAARLRAAPSRRVR